MDTEAMESRELSESNFKRILLLNWVISPPLMLFFAWPYLLAGEYLGIHPVISFLGSFIFAFPFLLTIMHGHVTMSLGSLHRHRYYEWLENRPLSYGLFFHPAFVSTRFRLVMLILSFMLLGTSYVWSYNLLF